MRQSAIDNARKFAARAADEGIATDGTIKSREIEYLVHKYPELKRPSYVQVPENKLGRGLYRFYVPTGETQTQKRPVKKVEKETIQNSDEAEAVRAVTADDSVAPEKRKRVNMNVETTGFSESLVPKEDPLFVPFGHYKELSQAIDSGFFFPIFVTGLSGNGKTYMVSQICARTNRELIRVNLTKETDEDSLIGGLRLIEGETKFVKGPVIRAMERGAVLLLDEIDLADPARVMCLQSIMEGSGYFIKRTGEFVEPADGFTIVATANTKGKGSDTGMFIGTNVLNEAFLERFPMTFEQPYPSRAIESKILKKLFSSLNVEDEGFIEKLVFWADTIRASYYDGSVEEIISTRRLVHISKAYAIYKDRLTAIQFCTNRFDEETKEAFLEFYTKVDADVDKKKAEAPADIGDILRKA